MKGLSFKRHAKETGLAAVGNSKPSVDIKLNGKVIGLIAAPNWASRDNLYHLQFMVIKPEPDDNPNCEWKWVYMKAAFALEEEARAAVPQVIKYLQFRHTLHFQEVTK